MCILTMGRSLVIMLFISAFLLEYINCENPGSQSGGSDDKPEVMISFDSTDCNSSNLFKHLKPIFEPFSECVSWHFVPCSTSKIVNDVLQCCGGVKECQIDVLHACAAHYYEKDQITLGKFFICMMIDDAQYVKGETCAKAAGMNWDLLNACQPSKDAGTWCNNRYKQLNSLHEANLPGVIYNRRYNANAAAESLDDLKNGICSEIKRLNRQCAACGSCGSGGGNPPGSGGHPPGSEGHPPSSNWGHAPGSGGHSPTGTSGNPDPLGG